MERTEYRVIVKDGSYDLNVDVNEFLEKGWECLGGVSIAYDDGMKVLTYAQAIIKKTQTK